MLSLVVSAAVVVAMVAAGFALVRSWAGTSLEHDAVRNALDTTRATLADTKPSGRR